MGHYRIELIVIDFLERMKLPQDVSIIRDGKVLYTGSATRVHKELLNEKVITIYTFDYSNYIHIVIE